MSLHVYLERPAGMPCLECDGTGRAKAAVEVFSDNITHNLGAMTEEAGIYDHLWHPEHLDIKKAKELIGPLTEGTALMRREPGRFRPLDASNGWGTYAQFLPWIERYLRACEEHPDATVTTST